MSGVLLFLTGAVCFRLKDFSDWRVAWCCRSSVLDIGFVEFANETTSNSRRECFPHRKGYTPQKRVTVSVFLYFAVKTYRLRVGSVQSKAISLFIFASLILTPLTAAHATDYPPSVPNSNVFTTSTEAPKVDGPTGAFTQRIPLDIPPGRNGLQPDIALDYNSQRTQDSIVGYGWSLSVPYIERLNKTGSQDLYGNTPYFTSSIEGELASEATTTPTNPSPAILDTLPLTRHDFSNVTSGSFSYTVPASGSNKLLACFLQIAANEVPDSITQNGTPMTECAALQGNE